ncbi:hypothetical protein [Vogesella sp. XCS3]|uniref:hypothetical protein n=1 Tax=Vogesella sp. XCS3 TaxID=2877939 RepID=UPI001D0B068E|nr:hypothetical protein [Vogesella sp. XCS3]UDM17747.1 hypothetical protein LCH97_03535 [Vogesella sp. XCS3]
MLANIQAEDFMPLLGQPCLMCNEQFAAGITLHIQAIRLRPLAQLPGSARSPFVVELAMPEPAPMGDLQGQLRLPAAVGGPEITLDEVWVGRVAAAGRDPAWAYFQLPFN